MPSPEPRFGGVYAASTTTFDERGDLDLDAHANHCRWLVESGVAGLVPCGSLGEYEALTDMERIAVVESTVQAAGDATVVPGVSGKSGAEARRWAEHAGAAGAGAVMCLPPTSHAPTDDEVVAHFTEVARAGLAIIVYNNPFSTRVDLTPARLARLADEVPLVAAVKEFSQDVRRVAAIRETAPRLEVLCGCDDVFVESMLMGATGWIAGFVNAIPAETVAMYRLCVDGRWDDAVATYRQMLPMLRYDALPTFVQAVKAAQEEAGRPGGPVRLPRLPLPPDVDKHVRQATRDFLLAAGR